VGLAQALEDAVQARAEAAEVLPVVPVGVEDLARLEIGRLDRLGSGARLEPEDRPVIPTQQRLAGEDLPLAVLGKIHRF